MKLSATGLIAFFNAFTAKPSADTSTAQLEYDVKAGSSSSIFNQLEARQATKTMSFAASDLFIVTEIVQSSKTTTATLIVYQDFTATFTGSGSYVLPLPVPSATLIGTPPHTSAPGVSSITIIGTPVHINGPTSTFVSSLTEVTCTGKATCTPSTTAVSYTCPIKNGVTQAVTTTMQYFSCTTGHSCTGSAFATTFSCGCGQPICTVNVPFIPIPVVYIPPAAPLPVVPEEVIPEGNPYTVPTLTSQSPNTVTSPKSEDQSGKTSSQPQTSSSTSSSSRTTSSSSASSSSADACALTSSIAASDWERTLTAWLNQFPFTLPTSTTSSSSSTATSVSSKSTTTSQKATSLSSKTTTTSSVIIITSAPPLSSTSKDSSSMFSDLGALASSTSSLSAFRASVSSAESASKASASRASESKQAEEAKATCAHYGKFVQSRPNELPYAWHQLNNLATDPPHRCILDPKKVPAYVKIANGWKADTWKDFYEFQPFSIAPGWDPEHPDRDLVDVFCQKLIDADVGVTYNGPTTGICQVYNNRAASGATVVFSVTYRTNTPRCTTEQTNMPTYYRQMTFATCKKKLMDNLINPCTMTKSDLFRSLKDYPVLGGTFFDGCMQYTMVARKTPPKVAWGPDNRTD